MDESQGSNVVSIMRAQAVYDELMRRTREESLLASCAELLGWDEDTYMPRAGVGHRANQLALLAGLLHARSTDPRIGELLAAVEGSSLVRDPLSPAAVNVREVRRLYDRQVCLPRRLVEEIAHTATLAEQEWAVARDQNDFARFRPWLEKMVRLKRDEAEALGFEDPYDALLDEYEPGARSAEIAILFDALTRDLVPLASTLAGTGRRPDRSIFCRDYPLDRQRLFGEVVAAALGFNFEAGRLDTAPHPFFSGIGPGDCRITTRYSPHLDDGFYALLHEVGHGLYEQGLDKDHAGTPMGEAPSLGLHESQARLWENTVGRSRAFWQHFFPLARRFFPAALASVSLEPFYFALNAVQPSLNRVHADEVTYNLHILIRFHLERALLAGDLKVHDLPGAWNDAYERYLGIRPENDTAGCLQDGHWGSGLIGYFPTYTLGNIFGAQLFAKAEEDLGDLGTAFGRGDFSGLLAWLRDKVYRQGSRYGAARLVEHVTGAPPDHRPLIQALQRKYEELYVL
jgi:carboxypeptidase Taq